MGHSLTPPLKNRPNLAMNNQFDADYFLAKFSAIPDEQWCVVHLEVTRPHGVQHCALGQCGENYDYGETIESRALKGLFSTIGIEVEIVNDYCGPTHWNGEFISPYGHITKPKARILQALHDIKSRQEQAQPKPAPVQQPCTAHLYLGYSCVYCGAAKPVVPVEVGCE